MIIVPEVNFQPAIRVMSRNALHLNAIKCPPDSSPQGDQSNHPNRNLKDNPYTNADPKVTTRRFTLRLSGTIRDFYQN